MARKKKWKLALLIAIATIVWPFLYSVYDPHSLINRSIRNVDTETGRMRTTRFYYWLPIHREYSHTGLSQALKITPLDMREGEWDVYPGNRAAAEAEALKIVWAMQDCSEDEKAESARQLLSIWSRDPLDLSAYDYIQDLNQGKPH